VTLKELKKKMKAVSGLEVVDALIAGRGSTLFKVEYKGHKYYIDFIGNDETIYVSVGLDNIKGNPIQMKVRQELEDKILSKNVEDVKKATKEIKKTATRLPKKKMTLESFMNEILQ